MLLPQTEVDREWVYDSMFGPEYRRANPEIDEFNVFSTSTLAYDIEKQVIWKTEKMEAEMAELNFFMLIGRAVHELLQRRLPPSYEREVKIRLDIPYEWAYAPYKGVSVIGHIDAISFLGKRMLEFKTTWSAKDHTDTYKLQEGFYASWMRRQMGCDFRPSIYRVRMKFKPPDFLNPEQAIDWLSDEVDMTKDEVAASYDEIVDRALTCATMLDEWWGNNHDRTSKVPV